MQALKPTVSTELPEFDGLTLRKAKALLLLEKGITTHQICKDTGLDHHVVAALADGRQTVPISALTRLRQSESEKLTLIGHKIMDSILVATDEEIAKMPIGQRMVALGISIDKRNLLEGLPTQRLEVMITDDAIDQEISRLEKLIHDKLKIVTGEAEVIVEDQAPTSKPVATPKPTVKRRLLGG